MAADSSNYSKATVYINGLLLTEESSVTVKRTSGKNPVKTVVKGLAGFSKGAGMVEISVSNAVPSADFELDPGQFVFGEEDVEVTIIAANRTLTTTGQILDDNFTHAVDSEAKLDFNFTGQPAQWQR